MKTNVEKTLALLTFIYVILFYSNRGLGEIKCYKQTQNFEKSQEDKFNLVTVIGKNLNCHGNP